MENNDARIDTNFILALSLFLLSAESLAVFPYPFVCVFALKFATLNDLFVVLHGRFRCYFDPFWIIHLICRNLQL